MYSTTTQKSSIAILSKTEQKIKISGRFFYSMNESALKSNETFRLRKIETPVKYKKKFLLFFVNINFLLQISFIAS